MKVLFVFVFTGFHGGEKALPKLGFAALIHQFYCARALFLLAVWSQAAGGQESGEILCTIRWKR